MDLYKFTKLFFKKRFVFVISAKDYNTLNFIENKNHLSFELISSSNFYKLANVYEIPDDDLRLNIFKNRLNYPDIWKCVIAILDGKPAGCHWILLPAKYKLFYDSFELDETTALFCGVFVNPNYRGKRVYNSMQCFVYNMWINNFPDRNIITIVEERNDSSLKSNLRIGLNIKGINYLIKFFGKNLFSIYYLPNYKIQIWNVLTMKKW